MKKFLLWFFLFSLGYFSVTLATPIPPRAFLEYRLRSPHGVPLAVTISATIPAEVCNNYDIVGDFLPVGERGLWPEFPTFFGDIALVQTRRICPGPPVMINVVKTYRFDPTPEGDDHLILLVPSEFRVMVTDIWADDEE